MPRVTEAEVEAAIENARVVSPVVLEAMLRRLLAERAELEEEIRFTRHDRLAAEESIPKRLAAARREFARECLEKLDKVWDYAANRWSEWGMRAEGTEERLIALDQWLREQAQAGREEGA